MQPETDGRLLQQSAASQAFEAGGFVTAIFGFDFVISSQLRWGRQSPPCRNDQTPLGSKCRVLLPLVVHDVVDAQPIRRIECDCARKDRPHIPREGCGGDVTRIKPDSFFFSIQPRCGLGD